jgi:hypothetical protein
MQASKPSHSQKAKKKESKRKTQENEPSLTVLYFNVFPIFDLFFCDFIP